MVWGFKSCNFVHSANARPFVLSFLPFEFPSRRHLELWRNRAVPCPGHRNCLEKWRMKGNSVSNLSASSLNIPAIITRNQAQMRYSRVRIRPTDCQPLIGASVRNARLLLWRKRSSVSAADRSKMLLFSVAISSIWIVSQITLILKLFVLTKQF